MGRDGSRRGAGAPGTTGRMVGPHGGHSACPWTERPHGARAHPAGRRSGRSRGSHRRSTRFQVTPLPGHGSTRLGRQRAHAQRCGRRHRRHARRRKPRCGAGRRADRHHHGALARSHHGREHRPVHRGRRPGRQSGAHRGRPARRRRPLRLPVVPGGGPQIADAVRRGEASDRGAPGQLHDAWRRPPPGDVPGAVVHEGPRLRLAQWHGHDLRARRRPGLVRVDGRCRRPGRASRDRGRSTGRRRIRRPGGDHPERGGPLVRGGVRSAHQGPARAAHRPAHRRPAVARGQAEVWPPRWAWPWRPTDERRRCRIRRCGTPASSLERCRTTSARSPARARVPEAVASRTVSRRRRGPP